MIPALLHGKLSREQENMEDILTSCVFGILRYLPVEEGLLPLLCRAEAVCGEPPQLSSAGSHAPIYEFWPTLSERCVRGEIEFACHPCEPDLLIKLHKVDGKRLYVLIEAKHLSGKSSDWTSVVEGKSVSARVDLGGG